MQLPRRITVYAYMRKSASSHRRSSSFRGTRFELRVASWHVAHCAACMRLVPTPRECISMHLLGANGEANIDTPLAWHREAVSRSVSPWLSLLTFSLTLFPFPFSLPRFPLTLPLDLTADFRPGARRLPRGAENAAPASGRPSLTSERCRPCRLPARYPDDGGWGERWPFLDRTTNLNNTTR